MHSPEYQVALLAVMGLGLMGALAAIRWLFSGPLQPDPWGEQIAVALDEPESAPVCHRCLTEQSSVAHFCPQCGAAVGECNNVLPFEQIFSEGEVFRNGTTLKVRPRFLVVTGYLILSLAAYTIFAPVYWFFFLRNLLRRPETPGVATNG